MTSVSGDKASGYPTVEDAQYAIKQGLGYGSGNEPYINSEKAQIKVGGLLKDLGDMINSPAENVDLTKFGNIDQRAKVATLFAQGALAANRSAIASVGFKPDNTDLSTNLPPLTVGGAYDPETNKVWMNIEKGVKPSTVVHESIHRGLAELRKEVPEARKLIATLPNEEYVVRYMMATKMGNPEEGRGSIADEQRSKALALFKLDPKYVETVDKIEELAAEYRKNKRPGGPR